MANGKTYKRLIIVSNRLPFQVAIDNGDIKFSETTGGLVTGLKSFLDGLSEQNGGPREYLWVGWPGSTIEEGKKKEVSTRAQAEFNSLPVFLSTEEMEQFYHGFCNKTLWPLFHYFTSDVSYQDDLWNQYKHVNKLFCEAVESCVRPGDLVWIHDYHLMLLPGMLRETISNPIGFFLHIPFPSFEIFRLLPGKWRRGILEGLLGADLVGFHTYEYSQHFLQCVLRILGLEHIMGSIVSYGRTIKVDSFPMGIDYEKFSTSGTLPSVRAEAAALRSTLAGVRVIISVDRLDYTKGILNRLQGYELLLDEYPELAGKLVLVLVVVPSRVAVDRYETMKRNIEEAVGRINGKFGTVAWTPILYQSKYLSFEPLTALYELSDAALVTPLRDGMNLVAKEYVASLADGKGVLILSEMAGAAKELGEAIIINPNNPHEIAAAMHEALELPEDEQIRRNRIMQKRLRRYDVKRWAGEFLRQVESATAAQTDLRTRSLGDASKQKIVRAYRSAVRPLLLLDYDGTLVPLARYPHLATPNERTLAVLHSIAASNGTTVVVISGRDKAVLERWLGGLPIGMVAEHGAWIREVGGCWKALNDQTNTWKPQIIAILEQYVDRLPGSFYEEKDFSLSWHYRAADPEQSHQVARELTDYLVSFTANIHVQVLQGNKVIEIRNVGVDKGSATQSWISKIDPDFIMAIGDDATDEDMFRRLPETAFSIRVGMTDSHAVYNVRDSSEVLKFLESMGERAQKRTGV
jgi:trehalose 6-phosphate synthase/phosphatase